MEKAKDLVYRIALPDKATSAERRKFRSTVEVIRQVNPEWVLLTDWANPGEKQAYIVLHKDKKYPYRRAGYLITSALSRGLLGGYND